ncbi:unnamed protein product, partial [Mesorhabditis belari]|uniref:Moesin/ezrin/radixin homolog 1 n=1 Tax=Mesorhabditis belari TaxID=2138241 RepID=A0AAF3J1I3_9BILA
MKASKRMIQRYAQYTKGKRKIARRYRGPDAVAPHSAVPMGGPRPAPDVDPRRGKLMCVKVRLLDDSVAVFHLGHKALGQTLMDEVSRHLNLLEGDYFGLEFIDNEGCHVWLDMEKPILRQIAGTTDVKFHLIIKFYTPNPMDLEEEYTRYLLSLQIRRDLSQGHFLCAESTAALLAAYFVQSDCGDFSADDYPDASYLSHTRFIPNQTIHFQQKVMDCHKKLIGLSPEDADMQMLEVGRRCDFYGIRLHPAKDIEGTEACLAVMHLGIKVFHQFHCVSTFSWAKIRKLSFKRKKLLIKLHPDSYQCYKETIEFYFETRNECKNFWKKCVEHHGFFRCVQIEFPRKDTKLFSKGSSFRFHGRTQKQLIDYVREHHKRREPFTRPLRSGYHTCGMASSTPASNLQRDRVHSSMPHVSRPLSQHPSTTVDSGTLDARTNRPPRNHRDYTYDRMYDRGAISDVEGPSSAREIRPPIHPSTPENMSISLPNVLDEPTPSTSALEPPKSHSGDNFLDNRRDSKDFDNVSQDSYNLSDHDRLRDHETLANTTFTAKRVGDVVVKRVVSTKSQVSSMDEETQSHRLKSQRLKEFPFNQIPSNNLVPIEIDGPNVGLNLGPNVVPNVGPNVGPTSGYSSTTTTPLSSTFTKNTPIYTATGALLMKPKVIKSIEETSEIHQYSTIQRVTCRPASPDYVSYGNTEKRSTSPQTYGAIGPLPGKVITKDTMVITPEGIKEKNGQQSSIKSKPKTKPIVPPKPSSIRPISGDYDEVNNDDGYAKVERRTNHPVVNLATVLMDDEKEEKEEKPQPPPHHEKVEHRFSKPTLISVQSEDRPDIEKCQFFDDSSIPYTLTVRKLDNNQSTTSSFKVDQTNSLGRSSSKSPESFIRRKSLDLVPRKKLPSPSSFSSTDHTISPTTPESGDVLEYLLRKRSMSQERSALSKRTGKRADPRRQTQPVRFVLPMSEELSGIKSVGSTPALHRQSSLEQQDDDEMPPPPILSTSSELAKLGKIKSKTPPPPPPKSKDAAERVAQLKVTASVTAGVTAMSTPLIPSMEAVHEDPRESLVQSPSTAVLNVTSEIVEKNEKPRIEMRKEIESEVETEVKTDSPPFIDESPKSDEQLPSSRRTKTGLLWTDF